MKPADILFVCLWIAAAFVLFKGLDHTMLWQDEAHTALLAERILEFGYPKVWDGKNLVTGMNGLDFNGAYALTWDGWLPYYVTAGSFALLGKSVVAARLPFALAAVATIPLLYLLVVRVLKDRWTALAASAFLTASMAFLMHSRQCRYYALIPLAVLLAYHGLVRLPRPQGIVLVFAGSLIAYHSNLLNFAMLMLSFLLLPLFFGVDRARLKAFLAAMGVVFAMTFPMFLYTRMWEKTSGFQSGFNAVLYAGEAAGNLIFLNKFYLPLALLGAALLFGGRLLDARRRDVVRFVGLLCALFVLLIPFKFYSANRYLLPLLPAAALVLAILHTAVWRRRRAAGVLLLTITLTTHAWDYLPMKAAFEAARAFGLPDEAGRGFRKFDDEEGPAIYEAFEPLYVPTFGDRFWKGEYASLVHELFHPFPDGLGEVIAFLRAHRRTGERVYLSVGQYPLLFHAPEILLAYTISGPPLFEGRTEVEAGQWDVDRIDWFVPRFYRQMKGPHLTEDDFLQLARDRGWALERHELATPDLLWEGNWPYWFRFYRIKQGEFPLLNRRPTVVYRVVR